VLIFETVLASQTSSSPFPPFFFPRLIPRVPPAFCRVFLGGYGTSLEVFLEFLKKVPRSRADLFVFPPLSLSPPEPPTPAWAGVARPMKEYFRNGRRFSPTQLDFRSFSFLTPPSREFLPAACPLSFRRVSFLDPSTNPVFISAEEVILSLTLFRLFRTPISHSCFSPCCPPRFFPIARQRMMSCQLCPSCRLGSPPAFFFASPGPLFICGAWSAACHTVLTHFFFQFPRGLFPLRVKHGTD